MTTGPGNPCKKRILIVEDEMDMRFFLVTLLETSGYAVEVARNGRDGLRRAAAAPPDLILLDVMMPEQGGVLMYRQLKSDPDLRRIPVVMLSAIARRTFDHSIRMINVGASEPLPLPDAYIEKPPDPGSILVTLRRLL